jgi:hypothetical protein
MTKTRRSAGQRKTRGASVKFKQSILEPEEEKNQHFEDSAAGWGSSFRIWRAIKLPSTAYNTHVEMIYLLC